MEGIIIVFLLLIKHFIVDFPLQAFPYQYENKGTYGHPGGYLHAGLHVLGSFLVLIFMVPFSFGLVLLCFLDGLIHYHIDFFKKNITDLYQLKCNTSSMFWIILGFDQFLHQAFYVVMALVLVY